MKIATAAQVHGCALSGCTATLARPPVHPELVEALKKLTVATAVHTAGNSGDDIDCNELRVIFNKHCADPFRKNTAPCLRIKALLYDACRGPGPSSAPL
jgi:hypothetical protein